MQRKLLFDSFTWLVWLAPFAGVLAAGLTKRRDPVIEGDRVLRHDVATRIEHWTHGIGTFVLLVSGIALGVWFLPALVGNGEPVWKMMDVHFGAVVVFLFGTFYYGANTLLAKKRFAEHLPTKNAIEYTKRHYGLLLGMKKFTMPPEKKYFESERMAYILALASTGFIIVTGLLKVATHVMNVPGWLMGVVNPAHDIAAIAMLVFFLAHVIIVLLPMSWPILRSMFTGYVDLDYAKHEHAGWLAELGFKESDAAHVAEADETVAQSSSDNSERKY